MRDEAQRGAQRREAEWAAGPALSAGRAQGLSGADAARPSGAGGRSPGSRRACVRAEAPRGAGGEHVRR